MSKPSLLDLFSGAGGAARGYQMAGFHVTGIDHVPQPRYAGDVFIKADALEYVAEHGREYDAIHASPPCQGYSRLRHLPWLRDNDYPRLIEPTRELLEASGVPWVIENVEDAPMPYSVVLCGLMFGLPLYRHRRFGASFLMLTPEHPKHEHVIWSGRKLGSRYTANSGGVVGVYGHVAGPGKDVAQAAMGIDWMSRAELTQAIPPAMTQWVGERLLAVLTVAA